MQDGAISSDGQDDIRPLQAFLLGQILHAHGHALGLQAVLHQHLCPMGQKDLRRTLGNAVGHSLAGVWGNVDGHRPRPP